MLSLLFGNRWDPAAQHCYVVGGSSGLGLALAVILAQHGASVSIVARDETKLAAALQKLEDARIDAKQIFKTFSFAVNTLAGARDAYNAACEAHGNTTPDAAFLCAGAAYPGFWVEASEETIKKSMDQTYWVSAWSAKAISERMAREHRTGKIVFVASILAYFGITGYSTYAPGKFAIRGLAETLRQEMLLYGIDVHLYLPATFQSPSYEVENLTKPKITLKIEESDPIMTAEQCAHGLFNGVVRGDFHITDSFNGEAFRTNTRGSTPWNNVVRDIFYGIIGFLALPMWRQGVDKLIVQHKKEHEEYLTARGFFDAT